VIQFRFKIEEREAMFLASRCFSITSKTVFRALSL
jgi:hypothetical protein